MSTVSEIHEDLMNIIYDRLTSQHLDPDDAQYVVDDIDHELRRAVRSAKRNEKLRKEEEKRDAADS